MEEIKNIPEEKWKHLVKTKSIENALIDLNSNQGSMSHQKTELVISPYLTSITEDFCIKTASFNAKTQSYMIENVKCNYKEQYMPNLICNSCRLSECNQMHLLQCSSLIGSNELLTYIPEYNDIFDDKKTEEQFYIARLMMKNLEKKKIIENLS
jgi:hypothetical protein